MLDPAKGPVLPDEDPQQRRGILESISSYQEAQDSRPTFRTGQLPARYRCDAPPLRLSLLKNRAK